MSNYKGGSYPTYPDLRGKRVIVTGATSGIGKEAARGFAFQGCCVALLSRSGAKLLAVAKELYDETGASFHTVEVDLADLADTRKAVIEAVEKLGGLDILVNNGPGIAPGNQEKYAAGRESEVVEDIYRVNVGSFLTAINASFDALKASHGSIINMSSISALMVTPNICDPATNGYNEAKAGVNMLTKRLALQYGPFGVRVNAVAPGIIETPAWDNLAATSGTTSASMLSAFPAMTPLQCNGTAQDVAEAVLFLVSGAAKFVTGHVMVVDGGIMLAHPSTMGVMVA